jgi:hypothetical protein
VAGTVLSVDGKPLAGAVVALARLQDSQTYVVQPGFGRPSAPLRIVQNTVQAGTKVVTGSDGWFAFAPQPGPYQIIVMHPTGFATVAQGGPNAPLRLQPWARVEGVLRGPDREPLAGQQVRLFLQLERDPNYRDNYIYTLVAHTDARGRYVFDRVAPGRIRLARWLTSGAGGQRFEGAGVATVVEARPGQTQEVQLGGTGRTIIGRVSATAAFPESLAVFGDDDHQYVAMLVPDPPAGLAATTAPSATRPVPHSQPTTAPSPSDERPVTRFFPIEADGSFRIDGVADGRYKLDVRVMGNLREAAANTNRGVGIDVVREGTVTKDVTIGSGIAKPSGPVDVGELVLARRARGSAATKPVRVRP